MNKKVKSTVRRSFDFDPALYMALMNEAKKNARSFPAHVVRVLEEHIEKTQ